MNTNFVLTGSWTAITDQHDLEELQRLRNFNFSYPLVIHLRANYSSYVYTQAFTLTKEGVANQFQYRDYANKLLSINIHRDGWAVYLYR